MTHEEHRNFKGMVVNLLYEQVPSSKTFPYAQAGSQAGMIAGRNV